MPTRRTPVAARITCPCCAAEIELRTTPRRLRRPQVAVLEALAAGATNAASVARRTGTSLHAAQQSLAKLARAGQVVRVAVGRYALPRNNERAA